MRTKKINNIKNSPVESPAPAPAIKDKPGFFFCRGHLEELPISEQSMDPRYCCGCFNFLSGEVKLTGTKKADWVPVGKNTPAESPQNGTPDKRNATPALANGSDVDNPLLKDVTDNLHVLRCKVCDVEFSAKRSDAEFCSSGCRVKAHRQGQSVMELVTI